MPTHALLKTIRAGVLDVAYFDHGRPEDPAVVLLHGFPYDVHTYNEVVPYLTDAGLRVIVPYLRGYGPTQFVDASTLRSGEQAVLGNDLRMLMDSLQIEKAIVAGYDWGGRAACVLAAVWPERVTGLVTCGGYNIQNIASCNEPAPAEFEQRYWYQYYFHSERGRRGLERNREDICRLLWSLWSPSWQFTDAEFARSAEALHNPDFVDVVIHSYRHRYALVEGDDTVADVETALAAQPVISIPTIALFGEDNGVTPMTDLSRHASRFSQLIATNVLSGVGHNVPQEVPADFAQALLRLN